MGSGKRHRKMRQELAAIAERRFDLASPSDRIAESAAKVPGVRPRHLRRAIKRWQDKQARVALSSALAAVGSTPETEDDSP